MKTVVVLSDSHSHKGAIDKIRPILAENDYIIHLGDGANDMIELYRAYPDKVYVCNGNCDFYGGRVALDEWEIEIEGHKLFCCHGHKYRVKTTLDDLKEEAKKRGCDIALYGHTHIADIREEDGVTLINPGSVFYSASPSYCYLVLTKEKAVATIVPIR